MLGSVISYLVRFHRYVEGNLPLSRPRQKTRNVGRWGLKSLERRRRRRRRWPLLHHWRVRSRY